MLQLDNGNGMNCKPIYLLEDNNIIAFIQKGSRRTGWLTAGDKSCKNSPIILLNIDNSMLYTKGNACGIFNKSII